jgi:hypothetical protein
MILPRCNWALMIAINIALIHDESVFLLGVFWKVAERGVQIHWFTRNNCFKNDQEQTFVC